jgi:uncharacterized protein YeaC (DUF1315 family)
MTKQEREWVIKAIINCMPLIMFQHEQEKLESMMAKYVDPKTVISKDELKEDMTYLDKIYG